METQRLILRPIELNDIEYVCEYGCDEETGKYMTYWPKTKEQIYDFINDCVTSMKSDKPVWYEYVIVRKENTKVIGNISLEIKNNEAEIGWISNKNYWNNGYMSEAVNAIINFAFSSLNISKIIATSKDMNIASSKVMEKCNMRKSLMKIINLFIAY
jgi:ribosomal-protein-alanine N-acetyltransferase